MPTVYGDATGFQAYWAARGDLTAAAMDDFDINAALIVASEWLDAAFRSQFGGSKVGMRDQERDWPRVGAVDIYGYSVADTAIPREVLSATYEAAFRQMTTPGVFFKDYTQSKYKSVAISGAVSVEYATGAAYDFQTQFPQIAAILAPILTGAGAGGFSSLSGAIAR